MTCKTMQDTLGPTSAAWADHAALFAMAICSSDEATAETILRMWPRQRVFFSRVLDLAVMGDGCQWVPSSAFLVEDQSSVDADQRCPLLRALLTQQCIRSTRYRLLELCGRNNASLAHAVAVATCFVSPIYSVTHQVPLETMSGYLLSGNVTLIGAFATSFEMFAHEAALLRSGNIAALAIVVRELTQRDPGHLPMTGRMLHIMRARHVIGTGQLDFVIAVARTFDRGIFNGLRHVSVARGELLTKAFLCGGPSYVTALLDAAATETGDGNIRILTPVCRAQLFLAACIRDGVRIAEELYQLPPDEKGMLLGVAFETLFKYTSFPSWQLADFHEVVAYLARHGASLDETDICYAVLRCVSSDVDCIVHALVKYFPANGTRALVTNHLQHFVRQLKCSDRCALMERVVLADPPLCEVRPGPVIDVGLFPHAFSLRLQRNAAQRNLFLPAPQM